MEASDDMLWKSNAAAATGTKENHMLESLSTDCEGRTWRESGFGGVHGQEDFVGRPVGKKRRSPEGMQSVGEGSRGLHGGE